MLHAPEKLGPKAYNIRMQSGRYVDLASPSSKVIDAVDLAWALSNIARFNGHARSPVTVLEHLLNAYDRACELDAPEAVRYAALMHDAQEAFVGDVSTPLKALIGESYNHIEDGWQRAVFRWAGLDPTLAHHPTVKRIDREMLLTEARDFHGASEEELKQYWPAGDPLPDFLDRRELSSARGRFVGLTAICRGLSFPPPIGERLE